MPRSLVVAPQHREVIESALLRNGFARQQDLADDLGISRDTVSRFFNSKPVGYLNFYEICLRLGLSIEHITADFKTINSSTIDSRFDYSLQNLPHRNFSQLIGREAELQQLLEYISPEYRQHMTIVQGIGGIGKTSLVVEAAHRCWEAKQNPNSSNSNIPIFDAIIFTSAKDTDLLPFGIIPRPVKEITLQDILKTIARVLHDQEISKAPNDKQIEQVYESLGKQRTLLIVDNMETIKGKDREDVLGFLNNLPSKVQAIITTREKVWLFSPISLLSLSEKSSIQLIQQQTEAKNIELTTNEARKLYQRFGGVPLALIYLLGRVAGSYSLQSLLNDSTPLPEDIANFCFEESVRPLRQLPAHALLMSLAIFCANSEWQALAKVADLQTEPLLMEQGLEQLKKLSLVYQNEDRYKILPITREYALVELAKYPNFEEQARERWIEYYLEFTQKYGGEDWKNWRIKYDVLEEDWENTLQVLDWCAVNGLYKLVIKIWNNVDNYIDLSGDWDTRFKWWQWLEIQSGKRQDWSTYINALSAQAWILTLKGGSDLAKAIEKIEVACKVTEEISKVYEAKANLAIVHSIWLKIKHRFKESLEKLNQAKIFIEDADIEEKNRLRYLVEIIYYEAKVYSCIQNQDLERARAKILLHQVCEQGKTIGLSRFVNYAQNELANIAISEQDYDNAVEIINKGLREAKVYRESTRVGHWLTSLWRLTKSQGDIEKAEKYAIEALDYFNAGKGAGIKDAEEIKSWLMQINEQ